jgi:RNA polymerase sigma-70 factor (ECF subfamily)
MARQEEWAFTTFYDRHVQVVFALLSRMISEVADREEVLQETFWQIWREAGSYDLSRGTSIAWLIQIARSRALDRLRQVGKARQRDAGSVDEQMAQIEAHLKSPAGYEESHQMVCKAMIEIASDQREALTLSYIFGFTHTEISERLNLPLGTVKTRIQKGIHKLKELLS